MEQKRLNDTDIADICNKARPNAAKICREYLEEALSQAIEDFDADELETLADAFTNEQFLQDDLLNSVEKWKNRIIYFQLKFIMENRLNEWAKKCDITD